MKLKVLSTVGVSSVNLVDRPWWFDHIHCIKFFKIFNLVVVFFFIFSLEIWICLSLIIPQFVIHFVFVFVFLYCLFLTEWWWKLSYQPICTKKFSQNQFVPMLFNPIFKQKIEKDMKIYEVKKEKKWRWNVSLVLFMKMKTLICESWQIWRRNPLYEIAISTEFL